MGFHGFRHPSGFTLVEMMVVVAMVGILAAIAIPNYEKFVAKARQSEAKIALAAIYAAENGFAIEKGSFTACLRQAGYVPEGIRRYYLTGFSYNASIGLNCGPNGGGPCARYEFGANVPCNCPSAYNMLQTYPLDSSDCFYSASVFAQFGPQDYTLNSSKITTSVSSTAFVAGATGSISSRPAGSAIHESDNPNHPPVFDGWTIDHQKRLINVAPGI